jgi:hypothetical protein
MILQLVISRAGGRGHLVFKRDRRKMFVSLLYRCAVAIVRKIGHDQAVARYFLSLGGPSDSVRRPGGFMFRGCRSAITA